MRLRLRLLIVEDVPEQAEIVAHELTNAGFDVEWWVASDPSSCRALLSTGVDVIVADCGTRELDLPTLMAVLEETGVSAPVVSVSTDDREGLASECLRAGASAFLHKFRLDQVGDLVQRLVTERRLRHAAEASDARPEMHGAMTSEPDLILEIASDGRVLYVDPNVEATLGYSADELTGRRVFEFLHPDDLPDTLALLQEAIATGAAGRVTHRVRRRDGSWRWLDSAGNAYRSEQGERRILAVSKLMDEGFASSEARGSVAQAPVRSSAASSPSAPTLPVGIASGVAHDLERVLAAIAGEAERVKTRLGPEHVSQRELDRILSCVDRAADLVERLRGRGALAVSEAEAGQSPGAVDTPTILLVEEDSHLRARIGQSLEADGYVVLQAASGVEALEKAADHPGPIHLMLGDLLLPGIGGRELAERFCAARPEAWVILMGAEAVADGEPRVDEARRRVVLRKPFSLVSLRAKVREILAPDPVRGESR